MHGVRDIRSPSALGEWLLPLETGSGEGVEGKGVGWRGVGMRAMAAILIYVDNTDRMGSSPFTQGEGIGVSAPDALSANNDRTSRRPYVSVRQQLGKKGIGRVNPRGVARRVRLVERLGDRLLVSRMGD